MISKAPNARYLEEIGIANSASARDRDDFRLRRDAANIADGLDAFLFWHDDVGDDEVRFLVVEDNKTAPSILGAYHVIAIVFEYLDDSISDNDVVVDDKYFCMVQLPVQSRKR